MAHRDAAGRHQAGVTVRTGLIGIVDRPFAGERRKIPLRNEVWIDIAVAWSESGRPKNKINFNYGRITTA